MRTKAAHTFEICSWLEHLLEDENSERTSLFWGINQFFLIYRSKKSWLSDSDLVLLGRARDAMVIAFRNLAHKAQLDRKGRYRMIPKMHVVDDSFFDTCDSKYNSGRDMTFRDEESMRFFRAISLKLHPANTGRGLQRWIMHFSTEAFGRESVAVVPK